MLRAISYKTLPISKIELSQDVTPATRRLLLTYPTALRNAESLSPEAIYAAAILAPPVVYKRNKKSGKEIYDCIGNIRTVLLAKRLNDSASIRCNIVAPPDKDRINRAILSLLLSEKACLMVDPANSDEFLFAIYTTLEKVYGVQSLTEISASFCNKTSFLESFGIDRRKQFSHA